MPHAADNAHNLAPDLLVGCFLDAMADRIGVRPIFLRHRFVDQNHPLRALVVGVREFPASQERNSHDPHILRADRTEVGRGHVSVRLLLPIHQDAEGLGPPGKRQLGSQRRLAHSRLAADGFKQLLRKRQTLLSVGVGGKWQRDPRGQQTLWPKSERGALQPSEAFDQQPGSGQQHHGQRHLRHHEHRAHPLLAKAAAHRGAAGFQRLG